MQFNYLYNMIPGSKGSKLQREFAGRVLTLVSAKI